MKVLYLKLYFTLPLGVKGADSDNQSDTLKRHQQSPRPQQQQGLLDSLILY